jgi:hypothetical protein
MKSRVELIYDSDCPNVDEARREIEAALLAEGLRARWEERERPASDTDRPDAPGSPTVLVDGRDVAPEGAATGSSGGPSCRVYVDGSRMRGAPSRDTIREVLRTTPAGDARMSGASGAAAVGAVGAASTGAALASGAAAACCVGPVTGPLLVSILGAGGAAWAAGLKPYSGWLLAFGGVMLAAGFFVTSRARGGCDAPPRRRDRIVRAVLWVSAALWLVSATVNLVLA